MAVVMAATCHEGRSDLVRGLLQLGQRFLGCPLGQDMDDRPYGAPGEGEQHYARQRVLQIGRRTRNV